MQTMKDKLMRHQPRWRYWRRVALLMLGAIVLAVNGIAYMQARSMTAIK